MLELGIDELNIVLRASRDDVGDDLGIHTWPDLASYFAGTVADALDLRVAVGGCNTAKCCPRGYTDGVTYGGAGGRVDIAFHEGHPSSGVIVSFSAQGLARWREATGMEAWQLVQLVQSPDLYNARASRIDLIADYLDEGFSPDQINAAISSGDLAAYRRQHGKGGAVQLRRWSGETQGFMVGGEASTVYLGSRAKNTGGYLRIYDKRREQIERSGPYLEKARNCSAWVRFEARLLQKNAHGFGDELVKCASNDEYKALIAHVIADRYRFIDVHTGDLAPWTAALAAVAGNPSAVLLSRPSTRNYDLGAKLDHVADSSGIISLMHRADAIWGDGARDAVLAYLSARADAIAPNRDTVAWVAGYADTYRREFASVDDWLIADAAA